MGKNTECLLRLNEPIALIESVHNNAEARNADPKLACGLDRYLSVALNSKVMLRNNIWVDKGLVNGSIGFVRQILFSEGAPPPALPE